MCQIWQDIKNDGYKEGEEMKARKISLARAEKGWDSKEIAEIAGYDSETIEKWIRDYENSFSAESKE